MLLGAQHNHVNEFKLFILSFKSSSPMVSVIDSSHLSTSAQVFLVYNLGIGLGICQRLLDTLKTYIIYVFDYIGWYIE